MSKIIVILSITIFACMILESEACFGLFGGGGGCGCAPPPPSCGCGGRKKREVLAPQIKTQESDPCPQKEWKQIIEKNIADDSSSSTVAIQGALYKTFGAKFFVTCNEKSKLSDTVFASNGEGYCSHGNDKLWCQALALFG